VIATGDDYDVFAFDRVDQTVLLVIPSRPVAGEICLQTLRFSNTREWCAEHVANQQIDSLQSLSITLLKPLVVGSGGFREDQAHGLVHKSARRDIHRLGFGN
jgi:hypothetical protein